MKKKVVVSSFIDLLETMIGLDGISIITIGAMPMVVGTREDVLAAKLLLHAFQEMDRESTTQEILDSLNSAMFFVHLWGRIGEAEDRLEARDGQEAPGEDQGFGEPVSTDSV